MLKTGLYQKDNLMCEDGWDIILVSGLHGNEIAPCFLLNQIMSDLRANSYVLPDNISSITILNGVSISGIYANKREVDDPVGKDLNRAFGEKEHTLAAYKKYVVDMIDRRRNPYVIDIHSSPNCDNIFLFNLNQIENDLAFKMCVTQNFPYVVWPSETESLKTYAKGVTYEINGMGRRPEDIVFKDAITTLYSYIDHLQRVQKYANASYTFNRHKVIVQDVHSLFSGLVKWDWCGFPVIKDTVVKIADIVDFEGNVLDEVYSPVCGRIVDKIERDFVKAGEVLFSVQPFINLPE